VTIRISSTAKLGFLLAFGASGLGYGCGGSSPEPAAANGDEQASATSATTFQHLSAKVTSSAADYQATMLGPNSSVASCTSRHQRYDAEVRPLISGMVELASSLDGYLSQHGGTASADYGCMAAIMMDELDYHRSVACASSDLATIETEAARHVAAMTEYSAHLWERCQEVMSSLGATSSTFSPMPAMCESWDGRCASMMHSECCHPSEGTGSGQSSMMDGTNLMDVSCVDQ
jgi:hypothetical protein